MHCVVTAGPTYERMDDVRRLTNFSTGRLGVELAGFLHAQGHDVTLLVGEQSTWVGERRATTVTPFSTTDDLRRRLEELGGGRVDALFHVAAVSDFTFGRIYERDAGGGLTELRAGKVSTRQGTLLAELIPTPKIIAALRGWFPRARIVGWKYEVDGDRDAVLAKAREQLDTNGTTACVANGRAYGEGFGVITPDGGCRHAADAAGLFLLLADVLAGGATEARIGPGYNSIS